MIALILGTSEGREFLQKLKGFEEKIVISTATEYGGELLKEFKVAFMNTKPLDEEGLLNFAKEFNLKGIVDASHPYAKNVSGVLKELDNPNIIRISGLDKLKELDSTINGPILNTTGSNGVKQILESSLENRVIHRVLPSKKVMNDLIDLGVKIEDIIAIKGPIGYELNKAFIDEYKAKALLTKDSGERGGALEKAKAALDSNIKLIIVEKPKVDYGRCFSDIDETVEYIKNILK